MRDRRVVVPDATAMAIVASEMVGREERRRTTRAAEGTSTAHLIMIVRRDVCTKQLMLSLTRDHFIPAVTRPNS